MLSMPNAMVSTVGDQPLGRYNGAPSNQFALFHQGGDVLNADMVRWGSKLHWAKDRTPVNARVEKVAHGPYYKSIWPHRALAPINSWLEWVDEGGPKKQPYLIRRKDLAPILCAAIGQYPTGAWEPLEHDGFVIITADSQGGIVKIHDRCPVALNAELAQEWIDPATPTERPKQIVLLQGEPSEVFEWFGVDQAVGNVRNQGAALIQSVSLFDPQK